MEAEEGIFIFRLIITFLLFLDFRYHKKYIAENGRPGASALKHGKDGEDITIKVPVGTIIKDADSKKVLFDLDER